MPRPRKPASPFRTLRIVQLRFEVGLSANLDVRRAAADLAQTEAQRGLLLLQRAQAARALSMLLGDVPQPLPERSADPTIPNFAGGPPTGIPADLVAIESYSGRSASLRNAIAQSEAAFTQSNALYREGLTSLFDVLDAQRQLIGSRQSLIDSNAAIAFAIVDLYSATGAPSEPDAQRQNLAISATK